MTFDDLGRELTARLEALPEGAFLTLGEPAEVPEKHGLLRRRTRPAPGRYVQFRRDPGWLYGECVGSTLFGGDLEIGEADHQRLRALGWLAPGDPDPAGTRPSYPHYWCTLEGDRAADLAAMGVGALGVLGADPGALTWAEG
jgi:hypothetical protein